MQSPDGTFSVKDSKGGVAHVTIPDVVQSNGVFSSSTSSASELIGPPSAMAGADSASVQTQRGWLLERWRVLVSGA